MLLSASPVSVSGEVYLHVCCFWPAVKSPAHLHTTSPLTPFFLPLLICPSPRLVELDQQPGDWLNNFITRIAWPWQLCSQWDEMNVQLEGSLTKVLVSVLLRLFIIFEILFDTSVGRLSLFVVLSLHQNYFRVGIIVFVDVEMLEDPS